MAALKPFARCAFILATSSVPAFGGVMGQEPGDQGDQAPGKTIVSTPSTPPLQAGPVSEATPTTTDRTKADPASFKFPVLRNMRSPYRPLGLAPSSDQPSNAANPTAADPSASTNPPLTLGTTSEGASTPRTKPDAPAPGPTKAESPASSPVSSTPTASSPSSPATAPSPPSSPFSTPTTSSPSSSTSPASGPSPSFSAGSGSPISGSAPWTSTSSGSGSGAPASTSSGSGATSSTSTSSTSGSGAAPSTTSGSGAAPSSSASSTPTTSSASSASNSSTPVLSSPTSGIASTSATGSTTSPTAVADAYINFGQGPYADAGKLTLGDPKPWYDSPVVTKLFGGTTPDAKAQAGFESKVVSTVENTYKQSGVPVTLTTDPSAAAAHTMSVVSGAQASENSGAIGIASVGYSGFTFIDKFGQARSTDALATAVGNNLAHEMMHAFGVADHFDDAGDHVDAATTTWSSLTDPAASFSQPAASLLSTLDFQATGDVIAAANGQTLVEGDPVAAVAAVVPEPSTVALWALAGTLAFVLRRRS